MSSWGVLFFPNLFKVFCRIKKECKTKRNGKKVEVKSTTSEEREKGKTSTPVVQVTGFQVLVQSTFFSIYSIFVHTLFVMFFIFL